MQFTMNVHRAKNKGTLIFHGVQVIMEYDLHVQQHLHDTCQAWKRSGSVVKCLTRDRGTAGSSLTDVTVLCP